MKLRIAKTSPPRSVLLVAGVVAWLATSLVGQPAAERNLAFVEDDASLLSDRTLVDLNRTLETFMDETDCWIQVKTLLEVTDRRKQAQIFGEVWAGWNHPQCAVVFYFIEEASSARMVLAPGLDSRLSSDEIGAILRGVVVPRFRADDPEGAVLAGVQSLQVALTGSLDELPNLFRPRGRDRAIGLALIILAVAAFLAAFYQLLMVIKDKDLGRSGMS